MSADNMAKIFAKIFATLAFRGSKAMESNQQQQVHRVPTHFAVNYRESLHDELFELSSIHWVNFFLKLSLNWKKTYPTE